MSQRWTIVGAHPSARSVAADAFPLSVGGPLCDIPLPGFSTTREDTTAALIGLADGSLFVEARRLLTITVNGSAVVASQWLQTGDVVQFGPGDSATQLRIHIDGDETRLQVDSLVRSSITESAQLPTQEATSNRDSETPITAIPFTPRRIGATRTDRGRRPLVVALWSLAVLLAVLVTLLMTSKSVAIAITPTPDRFAVKGALLTPRIGDFYLLRPGPYRVVAELAGYRPLDVAVEVGDAPTQSFDYALTPLPGLLAISAKPSGSTLLIDGNIVGVTPLEAVALESGDHEVQVRAERHRAHRRVVNIRGRGERQELSVELEPSWASVTVRSDPPSASLRVDGEVAGTTPLTLDLGAGAHDLVIALAGYQDHRATIEVVANTPLELPTVTLELARARLAVTSEPPAAVAVDGVYAGMTPIQLELAPAAAHRIVFSAVGHESTTETVTLAAGDRRSLHVTLTPQWGEVTIRSQPGGAAVTIDSVAAGVAGQTVRLVAVAHTIELTKDGYQPYRATVTPRPGFVQELDAVLVPLAAPTSAAAATADAIAPHARPGLELRRIPGGRLLMGASRREPGRRANETLREIELVRPFALATHEVTNAQFRAFRQAHSSGHTSGHTLDTDEQPVVQVRWEDAARFCNWLSAQESLPLAYIDAGGTLQPVSPMTTGYRLPTEAEWELSARLEPGLNPRKYPWGDTLPVASGVGNYADQRAYSILGRAIPDFDDGFAVTAPVGSFSADANGIHDLGGNVAEWAHDWYGAASASPTAIERDPLGPDRGEHHVIRGASWMHSTVTELRLSYRDYGKEGRVDVGFRVARYLE